MTRQQAAQSFVDREGQKLLWIIDDLFYYYGMDARETLTFAFAVQRFNRARADFFTDWNRRHPS